MAKICHLENRRHFFCRGWSDLDKILETAAEWHVDCGDVVEIETRCSIPIWRTFGRIQWQVIPELPSTLQGAATWRNQCHNRATLQGVRIPSAILKIVFAIFYFFLFLMKFRLWRVAVFVSSPVHLCVLFLWMSWKWWNVWLFEECALHTCNNCIMWHADILCCSSSTCRL